MHIQYTILDAPPGRVLVAETRDGILFVSLGENALADLTAFTKKWFNDAQIIPSVAESSFQVSEYLSGERKVFDLKFDFHGTEFQKKVWNALLDIPYGETISYGELAAKIGDPNASRAVGAACGSNPIPLVVPCHRVLSADGDLHNYAFGLEWKKWLLDLESGK